MVDPAAESRRPPLGARTTPVLSFKTSSLFIFQILRVWKLSLSVSRERHKIDTTERERERDIGGDSCPPRRASDLEVCMSPTLLGVGGVGGALAICGRNGWPGRYSGWIMHLGLESPASSSLARMRQNSRCGVLRSWRLPRVWAILDISCGREGYASSHSKSSRDGKSQSLASLLCCLD